jgi:XTP/dITP diphosphohydrolase
MSAEKFESLLDIMYRLRKECPWDREQTNDTIKAATLEEAYEVVDAIDRKDDNELKKELGDLLLHILFHSVIAEEGQKFTIKDVITSITEKLIRRHPHIFGNTKVNGTDDIMKNWETIKLDEGRESVLEGIPKALSELYRGYRIQEKVSKVGFDWQKKEDVWDKVKEEIREMQESEKKGDMEELEEEIGDVFFSLINYARFIGINPENALRKTNNKFIFRFQYIEQQLKLKGKKLGETTLSEMDELWEESKLKK